MDDRQALAIVSALAGGANPATGEVFSADSPYQSPDVIRALFAAQQALAARCRGALPGEAASGTAANGVKTDAKRIDPNRPNIGKPWSADEDKQLLAAFDADTPIADIARIHGRTVNGVRARLEKHGRLEPSPATRWPTNRPANGASAATI